MKPDNNPLPDPGSTRHIQQLTILAAVAFGALTLTSCGATQTPVAAPQLSAPPASSDTPAVPTAAPTTTLARLYMDSTLPRPETPVSEILDDPAMDDIADIIHDGIDPHELDIYIETESHFIDDLDRDIAGSGFIAERVGVVIVTPTVTHLIATGTLMDRDGNLQGPGLLDQRTRSGTVDELGQSITPLDPCGQQPPDLIQSAAPPNAAAVIIGCSSGRRWNVDVTTNPPTVSQAADTPVSTP